MQLRKPESLCVFDDHNTCIRHVHADFDNRRRYQKFRFAVAEFTHNLIFFARFHFPVNKCARYVAENSRAQSVENFFRRLNVDKQFRFAPLNQRAHHVSLTPRQNLCANKFVNFLLTAHTLDDSFNRLAPRRQFLYQRNVQIAVNRQSHCARDWRRRHDKHIGHRVRFFFKRRTLIHAETMLFVRHDKSQFRERHALLNQRVRPDYYVEFVRGDFLVKFLAHFNRTGDFRAQQSDANSKVAQQRRKFFVVLTCQNLGRCHERALKAAFNGLDQCQQRDNRFAGTHVALNQAAHGQFALHVFGDDAENFFLVARQRERQRRQHRLDELAVFFVAYSEPFVLRLPLYQH